MKQLMDTLISEGLKIGEKIVERGEEGALNKQHDVSIRVNNPLVTDQEILEWVEKSKKGTKATKWTIKRSGPSQENGREIVARIPGGALKIFKKSGNEDQYRRRTTYDNGEREKE